MQMKEVTLKKDTICHRNGTGLFTHCYGCQDSEQNTSAPVIMSLMDYVT